MCVECGTAMLTGVQSILLADIHFTGNLLEGALWIVVGAVFAVYALRRTGVVQDRCRLAAVTLILFGISDFIEAQTGAWWRPWWLMVWKGVCVLVLAGLLLDHYRRGRAAR